MILRFSIKLQKGESLNQCLEMLTGAIDYLDENIREGSEWKKELGMIELSHFMTTQNATHQLSALIFFEKAVSRLKDTGNLAVIVEFCDVIAGLADHASVSIREKSLEIFRWIYDAFRPPFVGKNTELQEKLANQSRLCLIKGNFLFNRFYISITNRLP